MRLFAMGIFQSLARLKLPSLLGVDQDAQQFREIPYNCTSFSDRKIVIRLPAK